MQKQFFITMSFLFLISRSLLAQNIDNFTTSTISGQVGQLGQGPQEALMNSIYDVAWDGQGNMYLLATFSGLIYKISAGGILTHFAGNGLTGYSGDCANINNANENCPATEASFNRPSSLTT